VFTPAHIAAALIILIPLLAVAFFPDLAGLPRKVPAWALIALPSFLSVPYLLVALADGVFRWLWLALYALLPAAIAFLLDRAQRIDPEQRGNWRDFLILATLGLAVDLRWLEPAWPPHLAIFSKMILLDAGVYGFLCVRQLSGVGFDLRLRLRDLTTGLREFALYAPIALALGLGLGFLHLHSGWPGVKALAGAWIFTFFFIAIPEELFFRGWVENLLERRMGRLPALLVTAVLFGLSHFNKRAALFNWRYVLLAAIAGVFYGRAWRRDRRVGASAITHATVDAVWSLWLR
jgi:membrane protease YdiL (CAAX protease family)